jgi:hypothetical protein
MTYSSAFMSDLIRGIAASRPQVPEDWLFVQAVDSPHGAVASVMWAPTTADLIRGIVASRPQVAEDGLFVQDVDSPQGALVASVMWVATTTKVAVESTPTNAVKVPQDGKVCSHPREPVAQAWSDRAAAVDADRERVFPARNDHPRTAALSTMISRKLPPDSQESSSFTGSIGAATRHIR